MLLMERKVQDTIRDIKGKIEINAGNYPEIGLILGSGLGALADDFKESTAIPYANILHFPTSTSVGHKGHLVFGKLSGKRVVCMQGRFHYYEGYTIYEVSFPVRVMQDLGISKLIVTNSAGGINPGFRPGDLMLIKDHINLMGVNPLVGRNNESFGPRFPQMSQAYSTKLRDIAKKAALDNGIDLKEGVYAAVIGPSYETPAEIKCLGIIGADAVGMSTVPEVITANHSGTEVLGISCITNMAAGMSKELPDHQSVLETAEKATEKLITLVRKTIEMV